MMDDYLARLNNADMALWQQVEKSLLLAPYWLDGHYLSAQTALRLGYIQVADAIRDEVTSFLARLPALINLLFNGPHSVCVRTDETVAGTIGLRQPNRSSCTDR